MGYTLNRVTLFALIFSIGILVDDAIVVIENIHRRVIGHDSPRHAAIAAVDEVGNPTILATFTVIAAILPMAFVSGLMGPYMRPIPVGASFAMLISLVVAFVVTPWLALKLLAHHGEHAGPEDQAEAWVERTYRRVMRPLIERPAWRWGALGVVFVLLLGAVALVPLELVTVKMLPFDNKSELEVVVDAPEGVPLETTLAAGREIADRLVVERGVRDAQVYAGTASPITFNGLVRHYFLRTGGNVADVQVNLLPKDERDISSHAFALRVRPLAAAIAKSHGVRVKIVEVPPGPPVLSTLVAEVYGDDPAVRRENAHEVLGVFEKTEGVVDSDWYVEDPQPKARFVLDRAKAALTGVDPMQVAATLRLAVDGARPAVLEGASDREPVPIDVTLPRADRSRLDRLAGMRLGGSDGSSVPLGEIARTERSTEEPSLYRKNGRPVTYVVGEVAGKEESPVYAILRMADAIGAIGVPGTVVWDGEWRITVDVFRDLGVAFGAVLILIYVLVVAWFRSFLTPLLIMAPIPLTLVGILPGHAADGDVLHRDLDDRHDRAGGHHRPQLDPARGLRRGGAGAGGHPGGRGVVRGCRSVPADRADRRGGHRRRPGDGPRPDLPGARDRSDVGGVRVDGADAGGDPAALLRGPPGPGHRRYGFHGGRFDGLTLFASSHASMTSCSRSERKRNHRSRSSAFCLSSSLNPSPSAWATRSPSLSFSSAEIPSSPSMNSSIQSISSSGVNDST